MANRKITFEEFWKKYPLHKARQDAEKVWNRLSTKDQQAAFNGVDRYREYLQQSGMNIKYAQGWLSGRRWEDEYDEPQPMKKKEAARAPERDMETW